MKFRISNHAREEMERIKIPLALVESVLDNLQQVVSEKGGKKAYQSKVDLGDGKIYLLRAIVNEDVDPAVVVTVYRTSTVDKYWRTT